MPTCRDCIADKVRRPREAIGRFHAVDDTPPMELCRKHVNERQDSGQHLFKAERDYPIDMNAEERAMWDAIATDGGK